MRKALPQSLTAQALRNLSVVFGVLLFFGLATYLLPILYRFRPWTPGDPIPVLNFYQRHAPQDDVPSFAGRGYASSSSGEHLRHDLGKSVAENLGIPEEKPPSKWIEAAEYEGIEVTIEDPSHEGMLPFYEALERTWKKNPNAITRIAHYGDSSIATDLLTYTTRRRLQNRLGDGGHGFVLIARGSMPYNHRDITHRSSSFWTLKQIVRRGLHDGYYGYGGVQFQAQPGARSLFGTQDKGPVGTRASHFELLFQKHSTGGDVRIWVDHGESRLIHTRSDTLEDGFESIEVADGPHTFQIQHAGHGNLRLFGAVLERGGPGVVYDSIGLVGARAKRLLYYDASHISNQIKHRKIDLLILGFGGNEADDPIGTVEEYEKEFLQVIRHMRPRGHKMGCLVFAPLDQAQRDTAGKITTMSTIPTIVEGQRRAAMQEHCAFYNTYQAMGGDGSMRRWYHARPRLALGDLRHATPAGYEVIGNMLYKALLKGFAEYQARHGK